MSLQEISEVPETKVNKKISYIKVFSEELSKKMPFWPGRYHMFMSMDSETDYELFYRYHCLLQSLALKSWYYLDLLKKISTSENSTEEDTAKLQEATTDLEKEIGVIFAIAKDVPILQNINKESDNQLAQ